MKLKISFPFLFFLIILFSCDANIKNKESLLNEINSNLSAFSQYQGQITIKNSHIIEYIDNDKFYFRSFDIDDIKEITIAIEPNYIKYSGLRQFNIKIECKENDCIHLINGYNKTDGTSWDRMGNYFSIGFQNEEKAEYVKKLLKKLVNNQ
jgi:hypothetical protein